MQTLQRLGALREHLAVCRDEIREHAHRMSTPQHAEFVRAHGACIGIASLLQMAIDTATTDEDTIDQLALAAALQAASDALSDNLGCFVGIEAIG